MEMELPKRPIFNFIVSRLKSEKYDSVKVEWKKDSDHLNILIKGDLNLPIHKIVMSNGRVVQIDKNISVDSPIKISLNEGEIGTIKYIYLNPLLNTGFLGKQIFVQEKNNTGWVI